MPTNGLWLVKTPYTLASQRLPPLLGLEAALASQRTAAGLDEDGGDQAFEGKSTGNPRRPLLYPEVSFRALGASRSRARPLRIMARLGS
jgi:hypothetical protein